MNVGGGKAKGHLLQQINLAMEHRTTEYEHTWRDNKAQ